MNKVKIKAILLVTIQFLIFELYAQDNRVSKDEDLQNLFRGTWNINSVDNALEVNAGFNDQVFDTPIDGGLGFLLAAGAGYVAHGLNRKRRRRKNEQNEEADSASK
jgi:hypothetical protein